MEILLEFPTWISLATLKQPATLLFSNVVTWKDAAAQTRHKKEEKLDDTNFHHILFRNNVQHFFAYVKPFSACHSMPDWKRTVKWWKSSTIREQILSLTPFLSLDVLQKKVAIINDCRAKKNILIPYSTSRSSHEQIIMFVENGEIYDVVNAVQLLEDVNRSEKASPPFVVVVVNSSHLCRQTQITDKYDIEKLS